jgi:hypothetical protein
MTKNGGASNRRGGLLGRSADARAIYPPSRQRALVSPARAGSHAQILLYILQICLVQEGSTQTCSFLSILVIPGNRLLLDKLIVAHIVEKFPASCGTRKFITALDTPGYLPSEFRSSRPQEDLDSPPRGFTMHGARPLSGTKPPSGHYQVMPQRLLQTRII